MKLLVIDSNSLMNRAYYGIKLLTTKDGQFTNGIYGFLNMFLKIREMVQPDAVAFAFDVKQPTFRHKMFEEYKAGRHAMPDELRQQMPVLKTLLQDLGYSILESPGWEADDILGTLAKTCRDSSNQCFLATGDRDALQLAHGGVQVLLSCTKKGTAIADAYNEETIMEEYGVEPNQLIQVKALQGDASDNIPGVKGIGQKTALDLIQRFQTIDNIYENIDTIQVTDKVRNKLIEGKDSAYLSLKLGTIAVDAPISTNLDDYKKGDGESQKALNLLSRLEMYKMIDRLGLVGVADDVVVQSAVEDKIDISLVESTDELFALLSGNDAFFYPTEVEGELSSIYFSVENEVKILQPFNKEYDSFLAKFFADETVRKITFNTKLLFHKALELGVEIKNIGIDLMLAGYLLNPSASSYDAQRLMQDYRVAMPEVKDGFGNFDTNSAIAFSLKSLAEIMTREIQENQQESLLFEIEIPLSKVLAGMEKEGIEVDVDGIIEFGGMLQKRVNELISEIYNQVGYEFNLNSPKQLGEALFEKLMLPASKKTKNGYSTNAEVLEGLRHDHPVVEMVLEYRTLSKLKSTYCDGLVKVAGSDGRIHTKFNQVETRTGRISSLEPNLQNIPVRSELGRELRKFFRAKDGAVLIDADYSQIELRVLADLADDKNMIDAFNGNLDIHTITASQVFNLPVEMMTPTMRSRAKAVNFGIVYGIGAFSLAKDIGVTRKEADEYINGYLNHYQGVRDYMDKMIETAKANGFAQTVFGRRRYLPELASSSHMLRSFGERVARNMPIQGTAADIIKIAMVKVDKRLCDEKMKSKLILQVHDELIVEAPIAEAQKALDIVVEEMENACKMKVKLSSDGHIGKTWYDAKG